MEDIEALRSGASRWSMAGDKQLLDTLQSLHQKIVSKCSDANNRLCQMVTALDDANVHLHNVNNKFMALSNSQFIESRVYDDDIATDSQTTRDKEQQKATPSSDPHRDLVSSLQVLESFHEGVTIIPDSGSSSSDDEEHYRLVLRPKDVYSSRPLPYVIGTHAWRTKWHAGVIQEDSDTDSESKQSRGREVYSDSEPEDSPPRPGMYHRDETSTPSSYSSSIVHPPHPQQPPHPSQPPQSPADVANELARRLGAASQTHPRVPEPYVESPIEPGTARKVYRVDKPAISTVFSDEPPPLPLESDEYSEPDDNTISETSKNTPYTNVHNVENEDSEPEDIFAELKRKTKENKPYDDMRKVQSVADDLFGDFVGGFERKPAIAESTRNSTLSSEQYEPDLFDQNPTTHSLDKDGGTKKPIGGISLFGTSRNNESIGAAILKRHQRKSSDESDENSQNNVKYNEITSNENQTRRKDEKSNNYIKNDSEDDDSNQTNKSRFEDREKFKATDEENRNRKIGIERTKEKDLINDLFTKTKEVKKSKSGLSKNAELTADIFAKNSKSIESNKTDGVKDTKNKVDLFSDNIFDDIDDIFTSYVSHVNLKEPSKETPTKSLFDDDNDLFSENKLKTDVKESQTSIKKEAKSIFDSDDELFSEKGKIDNKTYETKALSSKKATFSETHTKPKVTEEKITNMGELISSTSSKTNKTVTKPLVTKEISKSKTQAKSLFDSDDDDDIFTKVKTSTQMPGTEKSKNHDQNTLEFAKTEDNIDIFGDKDDDENMFFTKTAKIPKIIDDKLGENKSLFNSPNLFDDDDDELFAGSSKATKSDEIHSEVLQKDETFHKIKDMNTEIDNSVEFNKSKDKSDQNLSVQKEIVKELSDGNINLEIDQSNDDDWDTEDKDSEKDINSVNLSFPKFANDQYDTHEYNADKDESTTKEQSVEPKMGSQITKEKARPEITDKHNLKVYENIKKTEEPTEFKAKDDKIFDDIKYSHTEQSTASENIKKCDIFNDIIEQTNPSVPNLSKKEVTEQKITGIFNDLPPEFEKPKEPKKSKNVNALFDDDSDDETFFKKNDTLIDESDKIDVVPSVERIFGLFEEPPAIDVDFVKKGAKNTKIEETVHDVIESIDKYVNFDAGDIFKPNTVNKSNVESKNTHQQSTADDPDGTESKNESLETKKIGKLRPINLNINVNSLLPGASPKKQQKYTEKSLEQTDGQITSKSNEELVNDKDENFDKIDTKITKSVSFDEKTDPSILDNKLSKERAKIQVKRRPSTRRARREAVKFSGIDFREDSTDNSSVSSSFDDHKDSTRKSEGKSSKTRDESKANEITKTFRIDIGDDSTDNSGAKTCVDRQDSKNNTREFLEKPSEIKDTSIENEFVTTDGRNIITVKENPSTDVKSKLVYILHDEDIFSHTQSEESKITDLETLTTENIKPENIKKTKTLNIVDDEDDLFKLNAPKTETKTSGIKTLGKAYSDNETSTYISESTAKDGDEDIFKDMTKQINEQRTHEPTKLEASTKLTTNKHKSSVFGDLSDSEEELFGKTKNKPAKNIENKNKPSTSTSKKNIQKMKSENLFSSDSEEDLFGTNKKEKPVIMSKTHEVEAKKKIKEVKGSLFSDIEDDDLFATTKQTEKKFADSKRSSSNATSKPPTAAEPVYDDPLSLLGDDDD